MTRAGAPELDPLDRETYRRWYPLEVRLADCDHYAHVNNAVYYEYFDTAINAWLGKTAGIYVGDLPALGVVVASSCHYLRELRFPDRIEVGLRVGRVGRTSVEYLPSIFVEADGVAVACATGSFVHVYVDPRTRRPVPVPERVLAAIEVLRDDRG